MARIAFVFTGGTISMRPDTAAGGNVPVLDGAGILALAPGVAAVADAEVIDWGRVPASHLNFAKICDISRVIELALAREDIDGAVVVQGTDTIEETAFAFDLLLSGDKPVVVTGSMRHAAAADYDGPRNLQDAARCVVEPQMRGAGVVVVMNGLIVAADQAIKTHTTAMDTFESRDGEPLGHVGDDGVRLAKARPPRRTLPAIPDEPVEDVHLITAVTGMTGALVRGIAAERPRGIVVAATGTGNTSMELINAVAQVMLKGTVAVLTTRCTYGSVEPAYAFHGGGASWQRTGAILTSLDGPKARVALALGLSAGLDRTALAELLA